MFEKEAEEWTIDYVCKDCSKYERCKSKEHCTCKECSKDKWQNGAEFGYIKGNEQLTKAKELIQDLIDSLEVIDGEQIRELKVVKEAEQFLLKGNKKIWE